MVQKTVKKMHDILFFRFSLPRPDPAKPFLKKDVSFSINAFRNVHVAQALMCPPCHSWVLVLELYANNKLDGSFSL